MTIQTQSDSREFVGVIRLDTAKNPLSLNSRQHWTVEMKLKRQWRAFAKLKANRYPKLGTCDVTLTWFVTTAHRRDEDNMALLLKCLCDGLVDAGVVEDDTPDLMGKRCRIERAPAGTNTAYMELKVESRKAGSNG